MTKIIVSYAPGFTVAGEKIAGMMKSTMVVVKGTC
jgi:hypothetical protein